MKKSYTLKVAGLERELTLCPLNDELYIGAFIIFGDVELTTACARELLKIAPEHDVMITSESKGIPLIYEMARQAGENKYIVARKNVKAYMDNPLIATVESITTKGQQILCLDRADADAINGKTVLLVDDVISTGESIQSLAQLAEKAGAHVIGKASILVEGNPEDHKDVINLGCIPVFPD
jgi:adenine phosphoribosyltransferase